MSFSCKFNFEIDGISYFITRSGNADKKGNVKVEVKFWKIENDVEVPLNGEARRNTNDVIRDYLGSYEDFILTTLSIQNNKEGSFIDIGHTDRKDLLSKLMGLTVFDELYNISNDSTKEMQTLIKNLNKNESIKKLPLIDTNIQSFTDSLKLLNDKTSELNLIRSELNLKISVATGNISKINVETFDIKKLNSDLESKNIKLLKLKDKVAALQSKLDSTQIILNDYNDTKSELLLRNPQENYNKFLTVENTSKQKKSIIIEQKSILDSKLKKLILLETHQYDPECEFCINNEFVKDALKAKSEIDGDTKNLTVLIEDYKTFSHDLKELEWSVESMSKLSELLKNIQSVETTIISLKNNLVDIKEEFLSENASRDKINENIELYNNNKLGIENNILVNGQIVEFKKTLESVESDISKLHKNIIDATKSLSILIEQKRQLNEEVTQLKLLETKVKYYELYTSAVSRDGIQYELISQAIPTIEAEINHVLSQCADFTISLQTDGKNVAAYINYDDKKWPLELSCGFERFVSLIAIRVALINISRMSTSNFIVLDEGMGALDSENLSSLPPLFTYLKSKFDFVIIISHIDMLRDFVDSQMEIKKQDGFSKITYI